MGPLGLEPGGMLLDLSLPAGKTTAAQAGTRSRRTAKIRLAGRHSMPPGFCESVLISGSGRQRERWAITKKRLREMWSSRGVESSP